MAAATCGLCGGAAAAGEEGSWDPPMSPSPGDTSIFREVAASESGHAFLLRHNSTDLIANHFDPQAGWDNATLLATNAGSDAKVDASSRGDGFVVWTAAASGQSSVFCSRFVVGSGWQTAELVETDDTGGASSPEVSADDAGGATVAYNWGNGSGLAVFAARYAAGFGWGAPAVVSNTSLPPSHLMISGNGRGDVALVWASGSNADMKTVGATYSPGRGWTAPKILGYMSGGNFQQDVAMNANGQAVATWLDPAAAPMLVATSLFDPASGWAAEEFIGFGEGEGHPKADIGDDGSVFVRWNGFVNGTVSVNATHRPPGGAWDPVVVVSEGYGIYPRLSDMVADGRGNAMMFWWYQPDLSWSRVFTSYYRGGEGWGPPVDHTANGTFVWYPVIAGDEQGTFWLAWGPNTVRRFALHPDREPPPLSLAEPAEGSTSQVPFVRVSGTTEPGARVTAGNVSVLASDNGSFSFLAVVPRGATLLEVSAADPSGNLARAWRNVTYEDPLPGVLADLAAARGDAANESAALDRLGANLGALSASLNDTRVSLEAWRADANASAAQAASLEEARAAALASLNETAASLAAVQAQLADARAAMVAAQQATEDARAQAHATAEAASAQANATAASEAAAQERAASLLALALALALLAAAAAAVAAAMFLALRERRRGRPPEGTSPLERVP